MLGQLQVPVEYMAPPWSKREIHQTAVQHAACLCLGRAQIPCEAPTAYIGTQELDDRASERWRLYHTGYGLLYKYLQVVESEWLRGATVIQLGQAHARVPVHCSGSALRTDTVHLFSFKLQRSVVYSGDVVAAMVSQNPVPATSRRRPPRPIIHHSHATTANHRHAAPRFQLVRIQRSQKSHRPPT